MTPLARLHERLCRERRALVDGMAADNEAGAEPTWRDQAAMAQLAVMAVEAEMREGEAA